MLNAVKCPTSGYGRATWKWRTPASSGSGLPAGSAPKWAKVQLGLSSHHVSWNVRRRYSPLRDSPGTISRWTPTVQMRLCSRAVMAGNRVGTETDPKACDPRGPISQFWAMPS